LKEWKYSMSPMEPSVRGSHSSTFWLNLSAFCGMGEHLGLV
jgi:hypothetical protein